MSRARIAASAVYGVSADVLNAAIEAGHLIAGDADAAVTIGAKASPTGKDEALPYEKLVAVTAEGMVLLCGGKIEPATAAPKEGKDERTAAEKATGACDHFNYGLDLSVRQTLRGKLASEIEGPAKTIEKAAKALVEAGIADTVEQGREMVIAQRKAKGLAV